MFLLTWLRLLSRELGSGSGGVKKLKESALQIGDIVLTTTTAKMSKGIRSFTRSDISNVMVYVEAYSVIDATGEGVHAHVPSACRSVPVEPLPTKSRRSSGWRVISEEALGN
jgi:hypothetical protein